MPDDVPCALSAQYALLRSVDIGHEGQEHEGIDYGADCLIEQELDHDVLRALLGLRGLDGLDIWVVRGRGDVGGEEVFEESLPEDVRWVADDAEYGEPENLVDVQRKRRLCRYRSAGRVLEARKDVAHVILVC